MDIQQISNQMIELVERLNSAQKHLFKAAKAKAETERIYRMELAKEILRLKAEGKPAALIGDIARGSCADEKFERDFAEVNFKSTIESIEILKVQISALQSIYRNQTEL